MKISSFLHWRKSSMAMLRSEGIRIFLWRMGIKCFSPLGRLEMVSYYRKDLTQPVEEYRAKADATFCRATESDMDQITRLLEELYGPKKDIVEKDRNIFLNRFRNGDDCFVAKIGDRIINYNWIIYGPNIQLDHYSIQLEDDEAFTDDAYTAEDWRGKGIHTAGLYEMLLFLQQSGYQRALTCVANYNKSSRKTHHRLGWDLCGTTLYFVPRGATKARIWQFKGPLDHFI
jgi:hypothetical protein